MIKMPFSKIIEDVGLGGAKVLTDIQGLPSEVMSRMSWLVALSRESFLMQFAMFHDFKGFLGIKYDRVYQKILEYREKTRV